MRDSVAASSGVEALIDQLREQGVRSGQEEAARLVEEAEHRADWLVEQARQQAREMVERARREADQLRGAGEEALRIAARDVHLEVKESLGQRFTEQLQRLVAEQMNDRDFLRQLVLELVTKSARDMALNEAEDVTVLLPEQVIGLDELRLHPTEYQNGQLSGFVRSLAVGQLREGVQIDLHAGEGIRVLLNDQAVQIDLSSAAIARLLLKHLQPRFRAMLDGVIR